MSALWLPGSPAFEGFHPPDLLWQPVEESFAKEPACSVFLKTLSRRFGAYAGLARLRTSHPLPFGYYRLKQAEGELFLKVVTPAQAERHLAADKVVQWLNARGIATSPVQESIVLDDTATLLVQDYLPGRFCAQNRQEMQCLGRSLGRLHLALQAFPQAGDVKARGMARFAHLQARLQAWQKGGLAIELPGEVMAVLRTYPADALQVLVEEAQMVHGDLNLGNVWMAAEGDRIQCVFLDWEDSLSAWFNPMKDLAFVLERFVLTHDLEQDAHLDLGLAFLQAYYEAHHRRFNHPEHLTELLQALAVRALLLLIEAAQVAHQPLSAEWKKFVFLYKLADQQRPLLQSILCQAAESALNSSLPPAIPPPRSRSKS